MRIFDLLKALLLPALSNTALPGGCGCSLVTAKWTQKFKSYRRFSVHTEGVFS